MAGTDSSYTAATATWTVTFPNYTVSGTVACSSLIGSYGKAYPEYNNQITAGYQDGQLNCWCQMTYPVRSAWVAYTPRSSATTCAGDCVLACSNGVRNAADFRAGMFNTAGN